MAFMNVSNNAVGLALASSHAVGSNAFTVAGGASELPSAPFRLTVVTASSYQTNAETLSIYEATSVSGNTITVSGAIEGTTDQAFAVGDRLDIRPTAGTISDLNNAVASLIAPQTANTLYAGPASGASEEPTFRSLGFADLPAFSVANANGFEGTVTNGTTTLQTTVSGLIKGASGSLAQAVAGTDFQVPITLTTSGTSGPATFAGGALNIPEYPSGGGSITLTTSGTNVAPTLVSGNLNVVQYAPIAQFFMSSGTYTIPPWATYIKVQAIGGGGGGGAGSAWTTGSANTAYGGSGGAGGSACESIFRSSDLIAQNGSSNVSITIGSGGTGGTSGSGGTGGDTKFGSNPFLWSPGGTGGTAGTLSSSVPSYPSGPVAQWPGGNGRNSVGSGASPTGSLGGGGGGGGGYYDVNGIAHIGTPSNPCTGILGYPANDYTSPSNTPGAAGTNGANRLGSGLPMFAGANGGSGGNAGPTGSNGGVGGNGGLFGGGGGGGGACGNGMAPGAGGNGGGGLIIVWAW